MMEVVCFGWGKKKKESIITALFISLSVPFSYLVHARVWDAVYPGERAELAQVCATRGSCGKSRSCERWLQSSRSWSACALVAGKEWSLPHEMPMWKIRDMCPSSPEGYILGRKPGLLRWSCLCRSPLLIQPRLEEITGLHLIHYQKISTCNEAGLTVAFYKTSWEECIVIKWSQFLPEPCALLSKMSYFWRAGCVFLTFFLTSTV